MKKLNSIIKIFPIALFAILFSCGKESKSENINKSEDISENIFEGKLAITSDSIEKFENDYKIDDYATQQKYAGKELFVEVICQSLDGPYQYPTQNSEPLMSFFTYTGDKTESLNEISWEHFHLTTDFKKSNNWQPVVNFTDGFTLGYLSEFYEGDDQEYLIYDKKHDKVIYNSEVAEDIGLYIRIHSRTFPNSNNIINQIEPQIKANLKSLTYSDELYNDLLAGNFYYYSRKVQEADMSKIQAGIVVCKYIVKGTVSKDFYTNNVYIPISLKLVNSEVVKTEWVIDKNKLFSKQIKFGINNSKIDGNDNSTKQAEINTTTEGKTNGIANKDKVYFYNSPDNSTIKKSYIVKGQQANIIEEKGDFYKVSFSSNNGKMTEGYMKISDLN